MRYAQGERHPQRKFTDEQVRSFRNSRRPTKDLALANNCSEQAMYQIRAGLRYKWVSDEP